MLTDKQKRLINFALSFLKSNCIFIEVMDKLKDEEIFSLDESFGFSENLKEVEEYIEETQKVVKPLGNGCSDADIEAFIDQTNEHRNQPRKNPRKCSYKYKTNSSQIQKQP